MPAWGRRENVASVTGEAFERLESGGTDGTELGRPSAMKEIGGKPSDSNRSPDRGLLPGSSRGVSECIRGGKPAADYAKFCRSLR